MSICVIAKYINANVMCNENVVIVIISNNVNMANESVMAM